MEHGVALETIVGHAGHVLEKRAFVDSAVTNMSVFLPCPMSTTSRPPTRFLCWVRLRRMPTR